MYEYYGDIETSFYVYFPLCATLPSDQSFNYKLPPRIKILHLS